MIHFTPWHHELRDAVEFGAGVGVVVYILLWWLMDMPSERSAAICLAVWLLMRLVRAWQGRGTC